MISPIPSWFWGFLGNLTTQPPKLVAVNQLSIRRLQQLQLPCPDQNCVHHPRNPQHHHPRQPVLRIRGPPRGLRRPGFKRGHGLPAHVCQGHPRDRIRGQHGGRGATARPEGRDGDACSGGRDERGGRGGGCAVWEGEILDGSVASAGCAVFRGNGLFALSKLVLTLSASDQRCPALTGNATFNLLLHRLFRLNQWRANQWKAVAFPRREAYSSSLGTGIPCICICVSGVRRFFSSSPVFSPVSLQIRGPPPDLCCQSCHLPTMAVSTLEPLATTV